MFADGGGLARPLDESERGSEGGRYPQYHRPRPYQPNPPNKNITTTMIKSVFVSIVVLSVNFRGVPCDRFRTSSTLEKDIAAVLAVHQDRKILYPPPIGALYGQHTHHPDRIVRKPMLIFDHRADADPRRRRAR